MYYGKKIIHSNGDFFNVYLLIVRAQLAKSPDSEFENFYSPNYGKFAVECD